MSTHTLHFIGGPFDQEVRAVEFEQLTNNGQTYVVNVHLDDQIVAAIHTLWAFKDGQINHAYAVCHPGAPQIVTSQFRLDTELYDHHLPALDVAQKQVAKELRKHVMQAGLQILPATLFGTVEDADDDPRIMLITVQGVAVSWDNPLNQNQTQG